MPGVFKREREREWQKGKDDSKYNTGGRAKGKKKKMGKIKGKELQVIGGNWFLIQSQISKRRNMSEKIERMHREY